jgi:DNA-binding LacI/PurR family transcriptional regulator
VPWVDDDHRGGLIQLMAHLEGQGYRRPALLSIKGGFSSVQDVEETFEKELRAHADAGQGRVGVARRAGRPRLHPLHAVPPQRPVAAAARDRQPRRRWWISRLSREPAKLRRA